MLQLKYLLASFCVGIVLFASCSDDSENEIIPENKNTLELISVYDINVPEPSGLSFNSTDNVLYTVSDHTASVYKLTLQGDILKIYNYKGDDLEGVSVYKENKLLLAEERVKQIIEYDINTDNTIIHRINYENDFENCGIEGVAYKENDGSTFILNEKAPRKLIRLRADFSVIAEYELGFATDCSGIFYDASSNNLWIVSDQNKTINRCTLRGALIENYSIEVTQAEGITIANNKIYVVSDLESKLYVYKKPLF